MKVAELTLMVKNANTIFAYWTILPTTIQMIENWYKRKWTEFEKALFIFDMTAANKYLEIPIFDDTDHLFIQKLEPNRMYMAEFGIKLNAGEFFPLLRSHCVRTPYIHPRQISRLDRNDQNWRTCKIVNDCWIRNFSTYTYYEVK
jgi:uncharacterized protein